MRVISRRVRRMWTGTFSIVARCPVAESVGVAVATAIPGAGAICPFGSPHGAISTQSFNNYYFGVDGLRYLGEGLPAPAVGEALLASDEDRELRQLLLVDNTGRSWAFTGNRCVGECGHMIGEGYAVAGNMLVSREVLKAMARCFEDTAGAELTLAERLLQVLEAGQAAGGDKRGKQSAALKVYSSQSLIPLCDLRVDEHATPVAELRRVYEVAKRELLPFMAAMPTRTALAGNMSESLRELLSMSPEERVPR
ncbi:hypothetical protein BLA39750_00872 [Burkholderia lata]|uniref:DUF1028 domain-containing protein n=2 Tax=Burkholderia lata (strain ATCC 17760 / DSM 23089 / LMG 22485 / NCIMB 9086 / R18194 / 383) TaxID=482957 RepID=A0A6P2UPX4_BURL3|nr:hypothetical protein BLA39750_00872 [Burkholderia lata]